MISIGRGEYNDICIPERYDTVSSSHADIEVSEDGTLIIIDHSKNGTIVNGIRISNQRKAIKYGDRILLSKSYELPWTLIDRFLPNNKVGGSYSDVRRARETEMINRERVFDNSYEDRAQSMSHVEVRNIEIESAKNSWSWGGFLLNWIWGLGHSYWWPSLVVMGLFTFSLLSIVIFFPLAIIFIIILNVFNIALSIFLGIKGNSIAWENGCFDNIEHFRSKERKWTIAGVIVLIIGIVLPIICTVALFMFGIALFNF